MVRAASTSFQELKLPEKRLLSQSILQFRVYAARMKENITGPKITELSAHILNP